MLYPPLSGRKSTNTSRDSLGVRSFGPIPKAKGEGGPGNSSKGPPKRQPSHTSRGRRGTVKAGPTAGIGRRGGAGSKGGRPASHPLASRMASTLASYMRGAARRGRAARDCRHWRNLAGLKDSPPPNIGDAAGEEASDLAADARPVVFEGGGGGGSWGPTYWPLGRCSPHAKKPQIEVIQL